jgi:hypothetical protein
MNLRFASRQKVQKSKTTALFEVPADFERMFFISSLSFFVLIQKRTKKDQARTLPLYALLTALPPHIPEWAALFVHAHAQYRVIFKFRLTLTILN